MAGKGKKIPSNKWRVRWGSPSAQLNSPYKLTRSTQSPTCPLPQDAYPGNPFPSSSLSGKSMNTEGHLQRQVRISLTKLHIIQLTRRWQRCLCTNATNVAQPVLRSRNPSVFIHIFLRGIFAWTAFPFPSHSRSVLALIQMINICQSIILTNTHSQCDAWLILLGGHSPTRTGLQFCSEVKQTERMIFINTGSSPCELQFCSVLF